jgi:hypothetical protein
VAKKCAGNLQTTKGGVPADGTNSGHVPIKGEVTMMEISRWALGVMSGIGAVVSWSLLRTIQDIEGLPIDSDLARKGRNRLVNRASLLTVYLLFLTIVLALVAFLGPGPFKYQPGGGTP